MTKRSHQKEVRHDPDNSVVLNGRRYQVDDLLLLFDHDGIEAIAYLSRPNHPFIYAAWVWNGELIAAPIRGPESGPLKPDFPWSNEEPVREVEPAQFVAKMAAMVPAGVRVA